MPQKTLSTTATKILGPNIGRESLLIQNLDSSNNVFIITADGQGLTTGNADFKIPPGASLSLTVRDDGQAVLHGSFSALSDAGSPIITIFEGIRINPTGTN